MPPKPLQLLRKPVTAKRGGKRPGAGRKVGAKDTQPRASAGLAHSVTVRLDDAQLAAITAAIAGGRAADPSDAIRQALSAWVNQV